MEASDWPREGMNRPIAAASQSVPSPLLKSKLGQIPYIFIWLLLPAVVYLLDWSFQISCSVCWYLSDHPPIFHPQHFPIQASLERPPPALPTLCATEHLLGFPSRIGAQVAPRFASLLIGRTPSYLLSDWSDLAPAAGDGASESETLRAGKMLLIFAYIHTGNRPRVLTLGGDY